MTTPEIERSLNTAYALSLRKPFARAISVFSLLAPDDRVAVCISGGKDSFLLAKLMQEAAVHGKIPFTPVFLAMDPGYSPETRAKIEENGKTLGVPLDFFETDVLRVAAKHAPQHPCFLCSKMRRGHLYAEAQKRGCNKIALGHHYDDAIETVLMGLLYGGQTQALLPRVKSRNYDGMELIRPLYFVRERAVADWAAACGLDFPACGCPAARRENDTKRAEIKRLIASLAAENPQVEANLLNAVKNVDTQKLLGWRDENGFHDFLDAF